MDVISYLFPRRREAITLEGECERREEWGARRNRDGGGGRLVGGRETASGAAVRSNVIWRLMNLPAGWSPLLRSAFSVCSSFPGPE